MSVLSLKDQAAPNEIFPSTAFVRICCRAHTVSYLIGTGVWMGRPIRRFIGDHPPAFTAEVNKWHYIYIYKFG